jgi:hypothetical protein
MDVLMISNGIGYPEEHENPWEGALRFHIPEAQMWLLTSPLSEAVKRQIEFRSRHHLHWMVENENQLGGRFILRRL